MRRIVPVLILMLPAMVCHAGSGLLHDAGREAGAVPLILEMAERALEQRHDPDRYRFSAEPRWIPRNLAQLPEKAVLRVVPRSEPGRHTTFTVRYLDGNRERESDIQLRLTMETRVPVAAERIPAGTQIEPGHLVIQWVETNRDRGQLVTDPGEITGMTIRRTLALGEPIRRSDLTTDYLVEAGETVNLVFSGGGIQIELVAVARQNGAADEDIRVYSEETRRTYLATVSKPGTVVWKRTL